MILKEILPRNALFCDMVYVWVGGWVSGVCLWGERRRGEKLKKVIETFLFFQITEGPLKKHEDLQ